MKILMISSFLPYPLYSGGNIRLYNILKRLRKNHEITLVCEKRPYQTEEDVNEIKKICKQVITFDRKKQWSFSNILKTGFSTKSFLIVGHSLPNMRERIGNLLGSEKFDLIHLETFYIMQNLPYTNIPTVLCDHNIEYDVYKRYADRSGILKSLLKIDVRKLKLAEEASWKKSNAVIAVSEKDSRVIKNYNERTFIIPNGVDIKQFTFNIPASQRGEPHLTINKNEKIILFIGNFKWVQNRDAARLILKEIWPKLKSRNNLKLWIVGKNIPRELTLLGKDRVKFDEDAPDNTSLIFEKADILLAPLRIGGGTSYKILEAMASGVPVVSTRLGAEGLLAKDGREIIIAESQREIISSIERLVDDEKLYEKIAKGGRLLVEENYDWDRIVKDLEKIYENLKN